MSRDESGTLNETALKLGRKVREAFESEVVELDVAVAQSQHKYDQFVRQMKEQSSETNRLLTDRGNKLRNVRDLDEDLRELSRPRDGFPWLNDDEYEMRMIDIRVRVQEHYEELTKRSAWSE